MICTVQSLHNVSERQARTYSSSVVDDLQQYLVFYPTCADKLAFPLTPAKLYVTLLGGDLPFRVTPETMGQSTGLEYRPLGASKRTLKPRKERQTNLNGVGLLKHLRET